MNLMSKSPTPEPHSLRLLALRYEANDDLEDRLPAQQYIRRLRLRLKLVGPRRYQKMMPCLLLGEAQTRHESAPGLVHPVEGRKKGCVHASEHSQGEG